jgi:hypothetical protein
MGSARHAAGQSDAWNAKATYDAAVKVKAAKGGVDVTKNVVDGLI